MQCTGVSLFAIKRTSGSSSCNWDLIENCPKSTTTMFEDLAQAALQK